MSLAKIIGGGIMKRLIKYFLFLTLCLGASIKGAMAYEKFYEGEYIDSIYVNKVKNGVTHYMHMQFLKKSGTNSIAYCLDPFDRFNANDNYSSKDTYSKISAANLLKIKLAAYYGYGYTNHTSKKWYAITQFVIWKYADSAGRYYFTNTLNGEKTTAYDKDVQELENLIANHQKIPSIAAKTYKLGLNETITLKDTNAVLKNYEATIDGGILVDKTSNQMKITGSKVGSYKIRLKKKSKRFSHNPIFYITDGAQNLMEGGNLNDIDTYLQIEVSSGSLKIKKKDADNLSCKSRGEGKLSGAIYGLYKNDKKVGETKIDENCTGNIENLEYGEYILKELKAGEGYTLDSKSYSFTIDSSHLNINLELTNKVIEKKIKIHKVFGSRYFNNYQDEEKVQFGVYDSNNQCVTILTTDKNGRASVTLPYGKYTLKQLTSKDFYDFVEEENIVVEDTNDQEFYLKNNRKTKRVKIYKIDKATKKPITLNHAAFTIYSLEEKAYIFHTINGQTTNLFTTDDDGTIEIEDLDFGKYELREIKAPLGYQKGKAMLFEVFDKEGILEIFYSNEKKKVRIQVPDTNLNISNQNFSSFFLEMYIYEKKKYC